MKIDPTTVQLSREIQRAAEALSAAQRLAEEAGRGVPRALLPQMATAHGYVTRAMTEWVASDLPIARPERGSGGEKRMPHMGPIAFVDLTEAYDCDTPAGAILNQKSCMFLSLPNEGGHVLVDLDDVRDAAGVAGITVVPAGFFDSEDRRRETQMNYARTPKEAVTQLTERQVAMLHAADFGMLVRDGQMPTARRGRRATELHPMIYWHGLIKIVQGPPARWALSARPCPSPRPRGRSPVLPRASPGLRTVGRPHTPAVVREAPPARLRRRSHLPRRHRLPTPLTLPRGALLTALPFQPAYSPSEAPTML